ncbi:hypothetical protein bpSLO_001247 (plasmid) [Borrelia parkeri]|nr:variable large family protein [Borrelia parkeri]UPA11391.1 hypothetical protein bpSLO_001247 [Borrelia parkeri]
MLLLSTSAGIGVDSIVKGIKVIVDVVFKEKGNAGTDKKTEDCNTARKSAADAAKIVDIDIL